MPLADNWARLSAAGNAVSLICLLAGWWLIRHGRVRAHRRAMLGALGASAIFLFGYLMHHWRVGMVRYDGAGWMRKLYLTILATHTPLAAAIPALALFTYSLAAWLYVSFTGLLIYFLLYHAPRG